MEHGFFHRSLFRRALHFNNFSIGGEDKVRIHGGGAVFIVIEVKHGFATVHAAGNGRNLPHDGVGNQLINFHQKANGKLERHNTAGGGGRAGSANGFDHIAIGGDLFLSELGEVNDPAG